jgi:hypothetical protein
MASCIPAQFANLFNHLARRLAVNIADHNFGAAVKINETMKGFTV